VEPSHPRKPEMKVTLQKKGNIHPNWLEASRVGEVCNEKVE
jgi:hypothetical protein